MSQNLSPLVILSDQRGVVTIEPLGDGRNRVSVSSADSAERLLSQCESAYPPELIERLLHVKGSAYLCQEITREENPAEILRQLRFDVLSYVAAKDLAGKRILDFACGCGASSMALLKLCPQAQVVGVELRADCVQAAREIAAFYGVSERATFHHSPDSGNLPANLGRFDFVLMSAVYEHLLPKERAALLPQLWESLEPGGTLFLNQTPQRFFPVEVHTTKLPLINYLPDGLALRVARIASRRVRAGESWESLLRRGIRGASVGEILRRLPRGSGRPRLLAPIAKGIRDQIDIWYAWSLESRRSLSTDVTRAMLKMVKGVSGVDLAPSVAIAIQKE